MKQELFHRSVIIVAAALLISFCTVRDSGAKEMFFLSFGNGNIGVKLYSDYFCGACRSLEPKAEYLIQELVKRNIITITFVDVPFHKYSSLYAKYFLYILNEKKEIGRALKARDTLFEAAGNNIAEKDKLEAFLLGKGFRFKAFDVKPAFSLAEGYLREDKIDATPTCVIANGKKREIFSGVENIVRALENLK